jgi:small ligand-binding sensory domain FIST
MGSAASTFEVRTDDAIVVVRAVERCLRGVSRAGGIMIFCSGRMARELHVLAEALQLVTDLPIVLVEGPGVLTQDGELEAESAATGLIWRGRRAELTQCDDDSELTTAKLEAMLGPRARSPHASMVFIRSEGFDPEQLWRIRKSHADPLIFGAGTYGDPGLVCVADGEVRRPAASCLRLVGMAPPIVRTAHSCRLLGDPMPITKATGNMIEEIGGVPALSVLERLGKNLRGQSLVFTVLAPKGVSESSQDWLVRGIQGVDPDNRSLLISQEAREDMHITFAVREAGAAREQLDQVCRDVSRSLAGSAPRFALYFNCSGRGRNLYNAPNVDTRALRTHFAGLPIAGFQSAFEIGPFAGAPALQLYTGILAVFAAPS